MNVKEYKAVDLKKKNGAYLSIKITREMNAYEVALPYVGHVTKVISMVARKGLSYGNLAEVKSRPIGSTNQRKTNWVPHFENKLSYAKDGVTILAWVYPTKNKSQNAYVEYKLDGKPISKKRLMAKGALIPQDGTRSKEPLVLTIKLEHLTIA